MLDLRVVNKHQWKMPIKYDDIKVVLDYYFFKKLIV